MLIFMTPNMNVNFLNVLLLIFKPKIVFDFLSKIASCRSRNHFMPPYQTAPSLIPTKLELRTFKSQSILRGKVKKVTI